MGRAASCRTSHVVCGGARIACAPTRGGGRRAVGVELAGTRAIMSPRPPPLRLRAAPLVACLLATACAAAPEPEPEVDGEEPSATIEEGVSGGTVNQAVNGACSTSSVKGLSLQIIEEGNCMKPGAFSKVPSKGSISFASNVFRRLQEPAKNRLVGALNAYPSKPLGINSMLRTVAQQYLLYRWWQQGRCGIAAAAKPGSSNHEFGLALDTSQYNAWKSILKARGFRWFGSGDPVHFDYIGSGAKNQAGLDVRAFQRLWNRNHPGDKITVDGVWGPQTESRLKKSPANGFKKGAQCASANDAEAEHPLAVALDVEHLDDEAFVDFLHVDEETDHDHVILPGLLDDHPDAEGAAVEVDPAVECDACVESVCDVDPTCCDELAWDEICVAHAEDMCAEACLLDADTD